MSLIEWQDSYRIGSPAIDGDHQTLVSLMNQLFEAREASQSGEVVGSVFTVLVEYTINHFYREERLMELGSYPDLPAHRAEHADLTGKVQGFMDRYAGGNDVVVDELCEFLKDWLVGHILAVDTRYKPYVVDLKLSADDLSGTFGEAEPEGGVDVYPEKNA